MKTNPKNSNPVDAPFRLYVGASVGGSLPGVWQSFGTGFFGALHGGVLNHDWQVDLEVALTTLNGQGPCCINDGGAVGTPIAVSTLGSVAYFIPLGSLASWPLRVGGGGRVFFTNNSGLSQPAPAFGEVRIDVVGVLVRASRHLTAELTVPSVRFMFLTQTFNASVAIQWVTSVDLKYVF